MKWIILYTLFGFYLISLPIAAMPFIPDSSQYIVAESSVSSQEKYYSNFKRLKEDYQKNNNDIDAAISIAGAYLKIARKSGDSRYYGLAEQAIKPWWNSNVDQRLNLIKAIILQFSHRFDESNTILNNVIRLNPRDTQALLLRANNLMSLGKYQLAINDCASLSLITSPTLSAACFVAIKGLQIDTDAMLVLVTQLKALVNMEKDLEDEISLWIDAIIVEQLTLHGQIAMAELTMEQLRTQETLHGELLLFYADVLLRLGRNSEVIQLLEQKSASVDAQLKLLMAKKQQSGYVYNEFKELEKRFENDALRGEMHFRERAIFEFVIKENYTKAFEYAANNWQFQRTMKDASLLYRCAQKINNTEAVNNLQQWRLLNSIKVEFIQNIL